MKWLTKFFKKKIKLPILSEVYYVNIPDDAKIKSVQLYMNGQILKENDDYIISNTARKILLNKTNPIYIGDCYTLKFVSGKSEVAGIESGTFYF
jgi:hypothetical protein